MNAGPDEGKDSSHFGGNVFDIGFQTCCFGVELVRSEGRGSHRGKRGNFGANACREYAQKKKEKNRPQRRSFLFHAPFNSVKGYFLSMGFFVNPHKT